jgi:hypothetical protein
MLLDRRVRLARTAVALGIIIAAAFVLAASALGSKASAKSASTSSPVAAAAAANVDGVEIGIGDNHAQMFTDPAFKKLKVKIARYFAPYDVATDDNREQLFYFAAWLQAAQAQGIQPLVAFYHNLKSPTKMPSVKTYTKDVKLFLKMFPQVTDLQPWNEANDGNSRAKGDSYDSPSPKQSAEYYLALKKACPKCTIVGLDVLDSTTPSATIKYINAFKHDVGKKNMPKIWGLHNYSDTNRDSDRGTDAVLADVPGQVWLTETGGLAKLSPSFKFSLSRQTKATEYMFKVAFAHANRIKRLYIYEWYGPKSEKKSSFDAGLTNYKGKARPAYCVVYETLLHKKSCPYKPVKN